MATSNLKYGPLNSKDMIDESTHQNNHIRMVFITSLVLILSVGGYVALTQQDVKVQLQKTLKLVPQTPEKVSEVQEFENIASEIADRALPWAELTSNKETYISGENIEVVMTGSSNGKDITGYDALIGFDPEIFEVVSVSSLHADFQIFHFNRNEYQGITAVKDLKQKNPTILSSTPLLKMVLRAKKPGEQIITILASKGQEKTQFVDKDVQVQYPQIGSLFVTVK